MNNPKIYFIPAYLVTLKHYARLFNYLKDSYDFGFLLIGVDSARRREMIEYCKDKGYTYYVISEGMKGSQKFQIPFLAPLKESHLHKEACKKFLETIKPAKIVALKTWYNCDTVLREANRRNIDTIILQTSSDLGSRHLVSNRHKINLTKKVLKKIYYYLLNFFSIVLNVFFNEPLYGFKEAIPKKIGVFYKERALEYIKRGFDPSIIEVVGPLDLQVVNELKQKIDLDKFLKNRLLEKYGFSKDKLKIVVILYRFYLIPDGKYRMTIEKHVAHNYDLFKMIRQIFPVEEAEIILRIHPSENRMPGIYEPYKEFDIKLCYGADTNTEEIVCLANLYIAEPVTSVNTMILACGTPAIFFNFSEMRYLDKLAKHFNIKNIVHDKDEFLSMLQKFRRGILEKQYDDSSVNFKSVDSTIKLINS